MIASWQNSHEAFTGDVAEASWLHDLRLAALARFGELGFPSTRLESWKYTSTKAMTELPYAHVQGGDLSGIAARVDPVRIEHAAAELVFLDGRFVASLSTLPEVAGLRLRTLAAALADDDGVREHLGGLAAWQDEAFTALNVAFQQDGLVIEGARHADVKAPVHVIVLSSGAEGPTVSHPRHLVVAAPGSRFTLVETLLGPPTGVALTNAVVEVYVGDNADVTHQVVNLAPEEAHLVHTTEARLSRDARYRYHATWLGGALTRSNVRVVHAGTGAQAWLDGIYLLGGRQHCDNHTVIDHAEPHCITREFYKGVLGGRAKGVFDGRIIVRQDAQQTDSTQNNRNLLLTDTADANAKPTLEIYADDVKCAHGTTVGQLDKAQLVYLRSRGIPLDVAKRMLTEAFVADRVQQLHDEQLRDRLQAFVDTKLAAVQEEA